MALTDRRRASSSREIIARYPQPRSALLPMLHLVQAEEGYVTPEGIELVRRRSSTSTTAEVAAVATFYTMYKRRPVGDYHVGVCTNTLCAVMGGDAIFGALKEHLGVGNDETTRRRRVTLEHIECNAACDYAPVVMVNWEFFDNQTRRVGQAARRRPARRAARVVHPRAGRSARSARSSGCSPASPTGSRRGSQGGTLAGRLAGRRLGDGPASHGAQAERRLTARPASPATTPVSDPTTADRDGCRADGNPAKED